MSGMYGEEMFEGGGVRADARGCSTCGQTAASFFANPVYQPPGLADARGLTYADACTQARTILGNLSGNPTLWASMTCDQIASHIAATPSLFVCPDPIRLALAPTTCGVTPPPPGGGGTGGTTDNTMLIVVGAVAAVAILAAILAGSGGKKTLIAAV